MAEAVLTLSSEDYPPEPLSPVLPWCRERWAGRDRKKLLSHLKKLGILPAYGEIAASYLLDEPPREREDLLPMEKYYDREMIYRTTGRLFLSLLPEGTGSVNIRLAGTRSRFCDAFYTRLAERISHGKGVPPVRVLRVGEIFHWDGLSPLSLPREREEIFSDGECLIRARRFALFGDSIAASQYFALLYDKARVGTLDLNTEERASLFRGYGRVSLNLKLEDQALTSFNSLLNLGLVWQRKDFTAEAYRLTGEVYRARGRTDQAALFFRKSLSQKTKRKDIRLSGLFALFSLDGEGSRISPAEKGELITLGERENREKYLIPALLSGEDPPFDRIFSLLEKTKNPLLRSRACLERGLREWKNRSSAEETVGWLRQALHYSRRGFYPPMETKILFTMGQFYRSINDPVKSFNHYRRSIEGLLKGENFREIALAYRDLGKLALFLFQTERARSFLETAHSLLTDLSCRERETMEELHRLRELTYLADGDGDPAGFSRLLAAEGNRSVFPDRRLFFVILEWRLSPPGDGRDRLLRRAVEGALVDQCYLYPFLEDALRGEEFSVPHQKWLREPVDRNLIALSLKQHLRFLRLKKSMYEINLLWSIQTIISRGQDREMLILRTMEKLLASSLMNSISYYERLEGSYRLAYHSSLIEEEPDRSALEYFARLSGDEKRDLITGEQGRFCLPVYVENILSGLIICQAESRTAPMKNEEKQVYTILAGQFSAALERLRQKDLILSKNRQLEETNRELTISSLTDPLTGMGNRMDLDERLAEFARRYSGAREKDNFTMLFIDLDNFKYYNDAYGHVLGDKLLERFGRLLRDACRESDRLFRYGGDEFVILLAETDSRSATLIADRILYEMEEQEGFGSLLEQYGFDGALPRNRWLGCSIGISDFLRADRNGDLLLKQSDAALYRAKESGKKQWIIYSEEMGHEPV